PLGGRGSFSTLRRPGRHREEKTRKDLADPLQAFRLLSLARRRQSRPIFSGPIGKVVRNTRQPSTSSLEGLLYCKDRRCADVRGSPSPRRLREATNGCVRLLILRPN